MEEVIYTPDSYLRTPGRLLRQMVSDLVNSRELAWRLLLRNLSAQYRQTVLGYVWAFLPPLATTGTFVLLNRGSIFTAGEMPVPYPVYVMVGVLLWQTFVDALNGPLKLMESSKAMLAKINFPREALILAAAGEVVFNLLIRLILVAAVMAFFRQMPTLSVLLFPFGAAALILLGLVIGVLLTPAGVLFQDVSRGIALITMFWMLLTPVVYLPQTGSTIAIINRLNPVTPLLVTTRDCLLGLPLSSLVDFCAVSVMTIVLLFVGWVLFRISLPHMISRMEG